MRKISYFYGLIWNIIENEKRVKKLKSTSGLQQYKKAVGMVGAEARRYRLWNMTADEYGMVTEEVLRRINEQEPN